MVKVTNVTKGEPTQRKSFTAFTSQVLNRTINQF